MTRTHRALVGALGLAPLILMMFLLPAFAQGTEGVGAGPARSPEVMK